MQFSQDFLIWVLTALLVVMGANFILFLSAYGKFRRLNKHLERMLPNGGGLEDLVNRYLSELAQLQEARVQLEQRLAQLEKWAETAVSRVGLVRYNAFPGVGGDQSFSLALLKGNGEGIVISGIYGRDDTRVYAKPVKDGQSTYQLSTEEQSIIDALMH